MVVNAPMPNTEISDCEYRKQEVEYRQVLLSKFLQAMREDLSEWISSLTYNTTINQENFIESLENGVVLCQQARLIQRFAEEYAVLNPEHKFKIPKHEVRYTEKAAYTGSFVARDNVANFIKWCRELGIPEVCLFESDDLVMQKNEKSVILTLLDVARKAFTFGVQPPEIVRFEKEIDEEIEQDKEDERMGKPTPKPRDLEEDNNLDTMVRNIVNKCTCYDRFPIKKLAEGKYQFGKSKTLIFVRVMRKHVMVRVGGGWDTFDHYITKHDPCRTSIAGNIDSTGNANHHAVPQTVSQPNNTPSISPRRKKSAHEKRDCRTTESLTSSDTWSMCSGSSEGSGSTDYCYNDRGRNQKLARKNSAMSTSSAGTEETSDNSSVQFTKSIEEIDRRLKSMDNYNPAGLTDLKMKDPSVYENKADSWLRSHLNSLKQRRMSGGEGVTPMDEFVMKRGYTSDNIVRKKSQKQDGFLTPKMDRKSKNNRQVRSRSKSNGRESDPFISKSCSPFSTSAYNDYHHQQNSNFNRVSSTSSTSLQSDSARSCCNISTQTEFPVSTYIPAPLRKKAETVATSTVISGISSKIPRPVVQRSKTMDSIPFSSRLKRRNSTNSGSCASRNENKTTMPRMLREKSGLSNQPSIRREKSDLTGQRSKYKTSTSPAPIRRRESLRKEKPVRIRNGPVLTTAV